MSGCIYERGLGCTLFVFRPFHILLARLQRHWNIRRSLIHTFASFILLSYSRFILVSFRLLATEPLFTNDGRVFDRVMFFDGSIPFFGAAHMPFVVTSLLVLLSFGLIPPLLLIMPSISHNLNLIGRRWPNVCRYVPSFDRRYFNSRPKLNAFLEAFHGCYKDGTRTPRGFDYRWCAGFYLLLRAALYAVYAFNPNWSLQYSLLQLLFTMGHLPFFVRTRTIFTIIWTRPCLLSCWL